ncbi:hypothetical protein KM043_001353 [Ampulex compressa]|nr:hypothetical protein KM043_001353 [Ampulex compressa]
MRLRIDRPAEKSNGVVTSQAGFAKTPRLRPTGENVTVQTGAPSKSDRLAIAIVELRKKTMETVSRWPLRVDTPHDYSPLAVALPATLSTELEAAGIGEEISTFDLNWYIVETSAGNILIG